MPGKAAKVILTEKQQRILQNFAKSRSESLALIQRAHIILHAFDGLLNEQIARRVQLQRHQVGKWRRRWQQNFQRLVGIECGQTPLKLKKAIRQVLSDAPRAGAPPTFTPEQLTHIIATACEDPQLSGRPISHWTLRELAEQLVARKIVESISTTTIWELFQEAHLKPHQVKYWLHSQDKYQDQEGF